MIETEYIGKRVFGGVKLVRIETETRVFTLTRRATKSGGHYIDIFSKCPDDHTMHKVPVNSGNPMRQLLEHVLYWRMVERLFPGC